MSKHQSFNQPPDRPNSPPHEFKPFVWWKIWLRGECKLCFLSQHAHPVKFHVPSRT